MTDLASQTGKLRTVADIWSDCAADTWSVHTDLMPAVGNGQDFGEMAGANEVTENFNTWIQAMSDAARTGSGNFYYLSSALSSVADTYDDTDSTVAQSVSSLDEMTEES